MTERVVPYDLIFGASGFDADRFEQVREQDRDAPAASAAELMMLPAAGMLLHDLLPAERGEEHREAVAQVGALLFHAYRFWLTGRCVYRFTAAALTPLLDDVAAADAAAWPFRVPRAAGYVQLPRNALWARVSDDAAPEPVDGFFWSVPDADDPSVRMDLLLALGVRPNRPGVSLVEVSVGSGTGLEQWAGVRVRPDGADFENVLPGGELQGYHALTTHAEALKLAVLCFFRIDRAVTEAEGSAGPVRDDADDADNAAAADDAGGCVVVIDG